MSRPSTAEVDAAYRRRGVPLRLFGLKHTLWQRGDLEEVVRILHGRRRWPSSKLELFVYIHELRNPAVDDVNGTTRAIRAIAERRIAGGRTERGRGQSQIQVRRPHPVEVRRPRPTVGRMPYPMVGRRVHIDAETMAQMQDIAETPEPVFQRAVSNESIVQRIIPNRPCEVCDDAFTAETSPPSRITGECAHDAAICLPCLARYITTRMEKEWWERIRCPSVPCSALLAREDLLKFAEPAARDRLNDYYLDQYLHAAEGYFQCAHPGCSAAGGFAADPATEDFMICGACEGKTCLGCRKTHHSGTSCTDNQMLLEGADQQGRAVRIKQEEDSEEFMHDVLGAKACPKCQIRIYKHEGCDHMICKACTHQFCWECLADWKRINRQGNHMHAATCSLNSANLPDHPGDILGDLSAGDDNDGDDSDDDDDDDDDDD